MNDASKERRLRLGFPIGVAVVFWAITIASKFIDKLYFHSFITQLASSAFFFFFFLGWWWFNRGLRFGQKALGFLFIVGFGAATGFLMHKSMSPFALFLVGLPMAGSAAIVCLWWARNNHTQRIGMGFATVVAMMWSLLLLVRTHGADSTLRQELAWRWSRSPEELFLATAHAKKSTAPTITRLDEPAANEWTSFRGRERDGVLKGTSISTNWSAQPPTLVWKRAVGPAWASMITVGSKLFTQEHRGPIETVVCYNAANGDEIWVHEDAERFDESLSGIGPRATPSYENGRLYTLGATGLLNCLDAATGKKIWQKNIATDANAKMAQWGFSSSPFVADGKVFIYAGGPKGTLAYRAENGDLLWTADGGTSSYASPQVTVIDGVTQCLMLHDRGLSSYDISNGHEFWRNGLVFDGGPRSGQPRVLGTNRLLVGALHGNGTSLIEVKKSGDKWNITTNWISKDLKPEFPDFVVHKDHAYGFDLSLFCCINLADGKRAWKDGRYGRGQVVLLADQNVLLVASETGDLVLLAADPSAHRELGRIKAIEGKTWNGPIVRGDKIFHRNAQEMACYAAADSSKKIASR